MAAQDPLRSPSATRALIEDGAYKEAIALIKIELSRGGIGLPERLRISHVLCYLLLFASNIEGAIENAIDSLRLATEGGLRSEADLFRTELALLEAYRKGLSLRRSGDLSSSNDRFNEASRLAAMLMSPPYQLKIADVWSPNYLDSKSDPERYLALSIRALNLAVSLQFRVEASKAAKKIATYYALKNDYSRALSYYLKALNALDMTRNNRDVATCLNNIAGIYISLGDYAKAKSYLQEAVARLPEGTAGIVEASLFVNLGNIFEGLARLFQSHAFRQLALDCYSSYLSLRDDQGGGRFRLGALAGTASAYLDLGRLNEAQHVLTSALEEARKQDNDPLALGRILSLLGERSFRSGEIPGAEEYYKEARRIGDQANSPLLAFSAAYGLGRCAEGRGEIGQAVELYNFALQIIKEGSFDIASDIHRAEFIGRGRGPFQALMRLFIESAKDDGSDVFARELFRLAESVRDRSFSEFQAKLSGNPIPSRSPFEDPERARLNAERSQLLKKILAGNIDHGERKLLDAQIIHIDDLLDAEAFGQPGTGGRPSLAPSFNFHARLLDERTALLEYLLGDTKSALFCVTKDSFHLIELPPAREIEDGLAGFLSFVEDPSLPVAKGLPAAQRLYKILLSKAEPFLPAAIDRLVVIPDGILFRLPFEALVTRVSDENDPLYVSDRFTVSYSPSASSLRPGGLDPPAHFSKAALAIGAPEYLLKGDKPGRAAFSPGAVLDDIYGRRGFVLDPLPYVKKEIADLEKRFGPADIDSFKGPEATESAVKSLDLRAYRLIHFACHAFSDDSFPMRSALVFSPEADEREDGYLQVSEIYGLRTNADLIVLSACQTGRGKIVMNEGNLGLPRVFFYAGARSVLSTLWPVNDRSSATFMRHFYNAYFSGQGKAEALRTAKKAMRESKFAHPFYWAGYVLTGEL